MSNEAIKKALSVATAGSSLAGYLPAPLAMEVIAYIREINIMRRLCKVFPMNARSWKKPKKVGGLSAYYVPDGVTATLSSYSSTQVEWIAKKIMTYCMVDEEAIEDSQPDVVSQVLQDAGEAMGEAEESAFAVGDPTHLATAPTPAAATVANWFVFDPRLIFSGIFTVASGVSAATAVDASSAALDIDMINEAIYNLGKYGRNRGNLTGLLPSVQAATVRQDSNFKDASKSGLALASFLTGLGTAGEADGLVTNLYGVKFYEIPSGTSSQVVIFDKRSPEIGDRRLIKFKSTEVIEADQRKYVVSERVAFEFNYKDATVCIKNLKTTL